MPAVGGLPGVGRASPRARRPALGALGLLALVVAGCSGPWGEGPPPEPVSTVAGDALVHKSTGDAIVVAALPDAFGGLRYSTVATSYSGAEPSIGVNSKGAVFASAFEWVVRSTDGGESWQGVHKAGGGQDFDPMLWVDPITDRVLATHINPQKTCRTIAISDDDGETWRDLPMVCPVTSYGQVDHQKLASGPPAGLEGSRGLLYDSLMTLCYNNRGTTRCAASLDGGLTFVQDVAVDGMPVGTPLPDPVPGVPGLPPVQDTFGECGGLNGPQHHAADGTIYVPYGYECQQARIAVSTDGAVTWTRRDPGEAQLELDPSVTTTDDGTAYYLYRGDDQRIHLLRSKDGFATVDGPYTVSPPEVKGTVFTNIVGGSAGRIAVAYIGTSTSVQSPDDAPGSTRWHLYVGMSLDADADAPTFVTVRVTPADDPLQLGSICVALPCGGSDRNLLDFMGMAIAPDGRPWVAYADGCTSKACRTPGQLNTAESRDDTLSIAWMKNGPSLFASEGRLTAPKQVT